MEKKFAKKDNSTNNQPTNELQGGFANRLKKTGVALTTSPSVVEQIKPEPAQPIVQVQQPAVAQTEEQETVPAVAQPEEQETVPESPVAQQQEEPSPDQQVPQANGYFSLI